MAEGVKPLKFHLATSLDDSGGEIPPDSVNAWTNGEEVWVTRGMMRFIRDDNELAVVLGHEMSHAYNLSGALKAKRAGLTILGILGAIAEGLAGGTGELTKGILSLANAATMKFNRDEERKSDLYGLIWAHKAGFNVDAGIRFWERFAIEIPESIERGFLASHPGSAERMLRMQKIAGVLKAGLDPLKVFAEEEQKEEAPALGTELEPWGVR